MNILDFNRQTHTNNLLQRSVSTIDPKDLPRFREDLRRSLLEGKAVGMIETTDRETRARCFKGTPSSTEFSPDGIVTTMADLQRAANVGTASAGGFTVGSTVGEPEAALRATSVTVDAGAEVVTGVKSDHREVREDTPATFTWGSETADGAETDAVLAAVAGVPHRLSGVIVASMQLLAQGGQRYANYQSKTILMAGGAAIDRAALVGSGIAGEPLGIFNATGTGSISFGGAATISKVSDFPKTIVNLDGVDANLVWLAHGSVRAKWEGIARYSGGPPLWADNQTILGKRALVTSAIASTDIVCGDFTRQKTLFFGDPGVPIHITTDRITLAKSGKVRIIVNVFADILFTRLNQFVKNADSAVQ